MPTSMPAVFKKHPIACLLALFLTVLLLLGIYHSHKPIPSGLSFAGQLRPVKTIHFYRDLTWTGPDGNRRTDHEIFDHVLAMIQNARHLILIDMFLFNDFAGAAASINRPVSSEIIDALIVQKQAYPDLHISVITDPINQVYGGLTHSGFERLKTNDISVTFTRLESLRDSNPLYSSIWRMFIRPFGNTNGELLPNPFGSGRVSIRSYLKMLNFKANHRKVIIADDGNEYIAMVSSANPHDASSFHGNAAVAFSGPAVLDLLESEKAVLAFSGGPPPPEPDIPEDGLETELRLSIITENKIKQQVLSALAGLNRGDRAYLIMFYLSDRDIIHVLQAAHRRGAELNILLDPNKDAFGYTKNGIPNRQAAMELHQTGITVRWSRTRGEQAHAKLLFIDHSNGPSTLITGSANYTRRNLDNFNLETDIAVYGPALADIFTDVRAYCTLLWNDSGGQGLSIGYDAYADNSRLRYILYRCMEATGMCTF